MPDSYPEHRYLTNGKAKKSLVNLERGKSPEFGKATKSLANLERSKSPELGKATKSLADLERGKPPELGKATKSLAGIKHIFWDTLYMLYEEIATEKKE